MPDFTVIEGGGPAGRDRIFAEQEFELALREAAANILRVIRGAGKPHALLKQMSDVVAAAVKVREATGQLPTDVLETVLRRESKIEAIWEKRQAGKIDEASMGRWREDGTLDQLDAEDNIKTGVLQSIASQLVGQKSQECAGQSEMYEGINKIFAARQETRRYWDAGQRRPSPRRPARSAGMSRR
jgi:hypothetical protein